MATFGMVVLVVWIACGIIAYGRTKACWLNFLSRTKQKFEEVHELTSIIVGFLGMAGLIFILAACPPTNEFKFCFKVPKE